jgi:hypothetical protein
MAPWVFQDFLKTYPYFPQHENLRIYVFKIAASLVHQRTRLQAGMQDAIANQDPCCMGLQIM